MCGWKTCSEQRHVLCLVYLSCAFLATDADRQLLCAQAEAVKGQRVKITISDIVDRANGQFLATCLYFMPSLLEVLCSCTCPVRFCPGGVCVLAADPKAGSLEPTSPRSVEACLRLGIEPR